MNAKRVAAIIYAVVTMGVVAFQLALAAGAPWGSFAMGGAYPGTFPPALRVAAVVQAALLLALAGIVLARAPVAFVMVICSLLVATLPGPVQPAS